MQVNCFLLSKRTVLASVILLGACEKADFSEVITIYGDLLRFGEETSRVPPFSKRAPPRSVNVCDTDGALFWNVVKKTDLHNSIKCEQQS